MKKRLLYVLVTVAVAALVAPTQVRANVNHDSVNGSGKDASGNHLNLSAKSGPAGEDPKGQVHVRFPFAEQKGKVDCVHVVGNRAAVSGLYDEPVPSPVIGSIVRFFVVVEDNGNPSGVVPDRMGIGGSNSPTGLPDCGFAMFQPTEDVEQGNLSVDDAP